MAEENPKLREEPFSQRSRTSMKNPLKSQQNVVRNPFPDSS